MDDEENDPSFIVILGELINIHKLKNEYLILMKILYQPNTITEEEEKMDLFLKFHLSYYYLSESLPLMIFNIRFNLIEVLFKISLNLDEKFLREENEYGFKKLLIDYPKNKIFTCIFPEQRDLTDIKLIFKYYVDIFDTFFNLESINNYIKESDINAYKKKQYINQLNGYIIPEILSSIKVTIKRHYKDTYLNYYIKKKNQWKDIHRDIENMIYFK